MGLLDRLLGREERRSPRDEGYGGTPGYAPQGYQQGYQQVPPGRPAPGSDEAAIERYRYLLRTAPPETIEQAHAEAFAQLTPEQRRQVLEQLSSEVPPAERPGSDDPRSLARMATRAEMRSPGTLERSFGRPGMGMGGMIAGSLLASVAGAFVGTAIADAMFDMSDTGDGGADAGGDGGEGDAGGDGGGDFGGDVAAGGEFGGGDFGGGDFGGGDFGGGDFGGEF
ncbi:MAG: hypothetical protein JWP95_481 [Actinotalea sp.]|nr:hypothetical protein [Actinotalea sp.]